MFTNASSSIAQKIIPLTVHRKLHHIHVLPFDRVVVLDNRYDTTKIKVIEDGSYPVKVLTLNKPASLAIKNYIESVIKPYHKKEQNLYLNIKQLRFSNPSYYSNYSSQLFFSADAYIQTGVHFRKIATIKKDYRPHYHGYMDSIYRRTITYALNDLIENVNANYYKQGKEGIDTETYDSINTNVMSEWNEYAIIKNDSFSTNGVYETFKDFRDDKIKPVNFSLQMAPDSVFNIRFSENNKRYYSKMSGRCHHVFAVFYNGNRYISIFGRFFLPLYKMNNTFYFNVPNALPNMYSIISEKLLQFEGYENAAISTDNPYANLVGGIVGIIQEYRDNKRIYKEKQNILGNGLLNEDMRICFLDMDTGDIIYY